MAKPEPRCQTCLRPEFVARPPGAGLGRRFGIATDYSGFRFRSRLEATWAVFFDEIKLAWSYEPCDLDGYIPDFDLLFKQRPLLVEVKGSVGDIHAAKAKIDRSGWTGDACVVTTADGPIVGAMYEAGTGWDNAMMCLCLACKKPTIVSENGGWACRSCGAGRRELWLAWDPKRLWATSLIVTQWRKPA